MVLLKKHIFANRYIIFTLCKQKINLCIHKT